MKAWYASHLLSKMPRDAEVYYVAEPLIIAAGEEATAMDLVALEKVELDPDGSVVMS